MIWRPAERPSGRTSCRAGLDWDLWLGPRARAAWHPAYAPVTWRGFWDFGGGAMPDMGIHHVDPAFNALDLESPATVEATAYGDVDPDLCSRGLFVTWRFAATDKRGPLTVHWYDGGLMPPTPPGIDPDDPKQRLGEDDDGMLFVGEKRLHHLRGLVGDAAPAPARAAPQLRAPGEDAPPRRRATTPTGSRPARAARRPAATSATARG